MAEKRSQNPADLVRHYTDLIIEERRKLEEALANISEYADALKRIATDTEKRLLTRE